MQVFKDRQGKEWQLEVDLSAAWRIESYNFAEVMKLPAIKNEDGELEDPVYFLEFINPQDNLTELIITNRKVAFAIIWCCVQEIAEQRGIKSFLDFIKLFDAETFDKAVMVLLEELPNFFRGRETTLRVSISKYLEAQKLADEAQAKAINNKLNSKKLKEIIQSVQREAEEEADKVLSGKIST